MNGIPDTPGMALSKKSIIFIAVAACIIIGAYVSPAIPDLSYEGKMVLAILIAGIVLWITESIPIPATALLILVLMPLLGVVTYTAAWTATASSVVFFVMGCFAFTAALDASSIPTRIAGAVLKWAGTDQRKMLFGFMGAAAVLSMIMSDVAACGVFVAVGKRLLQLNDAKPGHSNLGRALMIGIPWASYAGGCAMITGNGCNVLTVSLFQTYFGTSITFVQWMALGIPCAALLLASSWFVLLKVFKPEPMSQASVDRTLAEVEDLDPLERSEKATIAIIACAIVAWTLSSWFPAIDTAAVAVIAIIALSIPGWCKLPFGELVVRLNWNILLMIMCILSVAAAIASTGAGTWLVTSIESAMPWQTAFAVLLVSSVIGCIIHNVVPVGPAVAGILAFPLGTLALNFGAPIAAMTMIVAWQASISYMLPLDCVPIQTYATKYYSMGDMVKAGWIESIVLILYTCTALPGLCALFSLA